MNKVTVIGSGCAGSAIGYALTFLPSIDEIVLVDVKEELAKGEAMDIFSGSCCMGAAMVRHGAYEDCADSAIIILTAGINRKPGQSRDGLLEVNRKIMEGVLEDMKPYYSDSFVIVVANPVDALTQFVADAGFIQESKMCGTGCMLDTARWTGELSHYLKVRPKQVTTFSVGKHGSDQHILWSLTEVDGMPVQDYCVKNNILFDDAVKEKMQENVTHFGGEVISRKGKTQYGIASVSAYLTDALLQEEERLVSVGTVFGRENGKVVSRLAYVGNGKIRLAEEFVGIENR